MDVSFINSHYRCHTPHEKHGRTRFRFFRSFHELHRLVINGVANSP